jgi:hypothetical protein
MRAPAKLSSAVAKTWIASSLTLLTMTTLQRRFWRHDRPELDPHRGAIVDNGAKNAPDIHPKASDSPMKKTKSAATKAKETTSPSRLIDGRIKELGDWRGETLARVRKLIKEACPDVVEEWKWRGVPVFEHAGIICTGETYKAVVKLTFAKGASLADPSGLFNSSLEGNMRRAIDIHEGDKIDDKALKALIRAAVALNTSKQAAARPARAQKKPKSA